MSESGPMIPSSSVANRRVTASSSFRLISRGLHVTPEGRVWLSGQLKAERETVDRYVAAYLSDQRGQEVMCRITGVQPFGFFATVVDFGGDGLVPVSTIGDEYFRYDEKSQQLVGDETGTVYRPGQKLRLRIAEADPVSGSLRFEVPAQELDGRPESQRRDRLRSGGRRGRPPNIRHQSRRR